MAVAQVLLAAQHVPVRLYPVPLPDSEPHRYIMMLETLRLEEKVKQCEGTDKKDGRRMSASWQPLVMPGEIARLREELARKDRNIEVLKKQAAGLHRRYDALGEKFTAKNDDGTPKKEK